MSNLDKIEAKIDQIQNDINMIKVTLAENTYELAEHIRRTEILEAQILPIDKHVVRVEFLFKMLGGLSLLLGICTAAAKLFGAI